MKTILIVLCVMAGSALAEGQKVTTLMSKDLPDYPGKEATMLTVDYAPGASGAIHRHNADAFVYVLAGSVVMQVRDQKPVTLTAGESFYEAPGDIHVIDRNASATQPARILVVLFKDKNAPVLIPAK